MLKKVLYYKIKDIYIRNVQGKPATLSSYIKYPYNIIRKYDIKRTVLLKDTGIIREPDEFWILSALK